MRGDIGVCSICLVCDPGQIVYVSAQAQENVDYLLLVLPDTFHLNTRLCCVPARFLRHVGDWAEQTL